MNTQHIITFKNTLSLLLLIITYITNLHAALHWTLQDTIAAWLMPSSKKLNVYACMESRSLNCHSEMPSLDGIWSNTSPSDTSCSAWTKVCMLLPDQWFSTWLWTVCCPPLVSRHICSTLCQSCMLGCWSWCGGGSTSPWSHARPPRMCGPPPPLPQPRV